MVSLFLISSVNLQTDDRDLRPSEPICATWKWQRQRGHSPQRRRGKSGSLASEGYYHGSTRPRRGNEAVAHGGLTRWSSSARVAPRRLAAAADFILHFGSVCGSSEGPPATRWPQAEAGAVASPRPHRGLWFTQDSADTWDQTWARVLKLRVEISTIKATIYRAAGTSE
jgi:hypothetical protein